jgi:hypothetical protein
VASALSHRGFSFRSSHYLLSPVYIYSIFYITIWLSTCESSNLPPAAPGAYRPVFSLRLLRVGGIWV